MSVIEGPGAIQDKSRMLAAAMSLPALILAGAVIGWWLDRSAGSAPVALTVGVIAGTGLGLWELVRALGSSGRK